MTPITQSHKNNNKISNQVSQILAAKGLSKIFNYSDYRFFKNQIKSTFNTPQAIAEMFIEYHEGETSDFNEYIF